MEGRLAKREKLFSKETQNQTGKRRGGGSGDTGGMKIRKRKAGTGEHRGHCRRGHLQVLGEVVFH